MAFWRAIFKIWSAPNSQYSQQYTAKTKYRNFETNTVFPEKEYRGLSPNFHIHTSVSHLYISTIGLPILLEEICWPILGLYKSLTDTWMLKLGLRPRYSQKRNTYMWFSLQCRLNAKRPLLSSAGCHTQLDGQHHPLRTYHVVSLQGQRNPLST